MITDSGRTPSTKGTDSHETYQGLNDGSTCLRILLLRYPQNRTKQNRLNENALFEWDVKDELELETGQTNDPPRI